ncbi:MAG: 3-phosphoshikimate 1-carboxyvinyltransferase [Acidimicrobiia bacterium]
MTLSSELVLHGGRPLHGRLRLPGCKGISHRALLFAAMADGRSAITNLADGEDVARTARALEQLGVRVQLGTDRSASVTAHGVDGMRESESVIDCGNSGTTMRMLCGLVAGRPFLSILTGDASLSQRPMRRVVEPLRAMGAALDGRADGDLAPLTIRGGALVGTRHELAVASGQVKTALVLAGLQATGETEIVEPAPSRDHTERMLGALHAPVERIDDRTLRVRAGAPDPFELAVPGDPSSAAFFVVAACIVPGSSIVLEDVSLNPARIEYLELLREMGAQIDVEVTETRVGEPVGNISVDAAPLHGIEISGREAIIDELPVLAVAGAFADGVTTIRDAAEMVVKETNRIGALEQELTQLGIGVETRPDGLVVRGGTPKGATLKSHGDHRIAMCAAVAGLAAEGETTVRGWPSVAISYPGFEADLERLLGAG